MSKQRDYFNLSSLVSLILAIIPVTAWVLGIITSFKEKRILAGIIRIVFGGWIVWVLDLICMIFSHKICRFWIII